MDINPDTFVFEPTEYICEILPERIFDIDVVLVAATMDDIEEGDNF